MAVPVPVRISKSKFLAGLQCLKRLYFEVHQPDLADEADESQEARLEQGQEVGLLAQRRFPGGALVGFEDGMESALAITAALVDDQSVPAIFEATFLHSNLLVRADILERRRNHRWRLIEVKSSVEVKPHYLYDLAIQYHVLTACGLDISSAALMHLSRDYRYDGKAHDLETLFVLRDQTRQIRKLDADVARLVRIQRKALAQDAPPEIAPGPQCEDPYQCEFFGHCNPEPPEHHISFLPRLSARRKQELAEQGVSLMGEIPEDFPLSERQARICASHTTGQPWVSGALARELSRVKYPLFFMDFETYNPAIPRFSGMGPYSQIPFQWSAHRQLGQDAPLEHFEFLADDEGDPRRRFLDSLCAVLGKRGRIVVYNSTFESQRLGELADWLPQYAKRIRNMRARLWDLWPIVKSHVYHPKFRGSFSLKSVLPALVPEMTYEGMEVAEGGAAGLAWDRIIRGQLDQAERQRLKTALLNYCRQDTLAMVRILERLREMCAAQASGHAMD